MRAVWPWAILVAGCRTSPIEPVRAAETAGGAVDPRKPGPAQEGATSAVDATPHDARDVIAPELGAPRTPDAAIANVTTDEAGPRGLGPFRLRVADERHVWYAMPQRTSFDRLIVMIHGVCTPPSYVCGAWKESGSAHGWLVCPEGNARCDAGTGPTWEEPLSAVDRDVERAIAKLAQKHAGGFRRDGAVLAGYSRGAYAAAFMAQTHPRRWPYLVINEADVTLRAAALRKAGVVAVALIAGEWGTERAGMEKTAAALTVDAFPTRLWIMPRTGHPYSSNIDAIMNEVLTFLFAHDPHP